MQTAAEESTSCGHDAGVDRAMLTATATAWCEQLWCYLGRPITVERVCGTADHHGIRVEVALAVLDADRVGWTTYLGEARDADPGVATARAVVRAVGDADPLTVPLWNLDTLGHLNAAIAVDGEVERPTIGADAEVERLRRLLAAIRPGTHLRVRTGAAAYRAIRGSGRRLALSVVDRPESLAAVDEWLSCLPSLRSHREQA